MSYIGFYKPGQSFLGKSLTCAQCITRNRRRQLSLLKSLNHDITQSQVVHFSKTRKKPDLRNKVQQSTTITGLEIGSCKNDSNLPMADNFSSFENFCILFFPINISEKRRARFLEKIFYNDKGTRQTIYCGANSGSSSMMVAPINHHGWYD